MKTTVLAIIAASALSLPALAQQGTTTPSPSSPPAMSSQAQPKEMSPETLKTAQVHQLQQALNEKGFSVGAMDGEWGPRTEEALKKFQGSKNMGSSGQLNAETISALGLNSSDFGVMEKSPQTTGEAPVGNSPQDRSNNEPTKTMPAQPH
jgi:peptidoglycan hydrolase-like protein with peptidoglycan-binding domain